MFVCIGHTNFYHFVYFSHILSNYIFQILIEHWHVGKHSNNKNIITKYSMITLFHQYLWNALKMLLKSRYQDRYRSKRIRDIIKFIKNRIFHKEWRICINKICSISNWSEASCIRRLDNKHFIPNCTNKSNQYGSQVHVWGYFTWYGVGI